MTRQDTILHLSYPVVLKVGSILPSVKWRVQ